jgi:hypothetical protein
VAGNNSEDSCIHAESEKGQLGHSGRLKVETDSDPPAVGGFEYLYVSYDPCSDGVPSAGCLARVLSATRGHLSESFPHNIIFSRRRKSLREKIIASASSTQAGSGTPQVG